jgi:hypothetical protein
MIYWPWLQNSTCIKRGRGRHIPSNLRILWQHKHIIIWDHLARQRVRIPINRHRIFIIWMHISKISRQDIAWSSLGVPQTREPSHHGLTKDNITRD